MPGARSILERETPNEAGVVESNGVAIEWQRHGEGDRTVLFVPTWNLVDSRVVRHQVAALRHRFRVITFDARGSGRSARPPSGYGFGAHAADALAVLDATRTDEAAVVTASRSANAAIFLAADQPDRVERVVFVAPAMYLRRVNESFWVERDSYEGWQRYSAPFWRSEFPTFARWFMELVFTEPDSETTIDEMTSIALEADPEILIAQETEQDWAAPPRRIADVRCPCLVIHGDGDVTLPIENIRAFADALPNGRLVLLDGLGHRPDIRQPDIVNPILLEFLERGFP